MVLTNYKKKCHSLPTGIITGRHLDYAYINMHIFFRKRKSSTIDEPDLQ